jgi:hypothetical protein
MNMPKTPVMEELQRIKQVIAARYNYDIRAMAKAFREDQKTCGHPVVSLPRRRKKRGPAKT